MRRRLFTSLSVLSLVAWIAFDIVMARSFWRDDTFQWSGPAGNAMGASVASGRVSLISLRLVDASAAVDFRAEQTGFRHSTVAPESYYPPFGVGTPERSVRLAGFGYDAGRQFFWYVRCLTLPLWAFLVVFALMPVRWLMLHHLEKARPPSPCLSCGYNLTGNTSGVCPECGSPATAGVKARDGGRSTSRRR